MRVLLAVAFVCVALLASSAAAFYDAGGDVVVLTPDNFPNVKKSKGVWLIEFYAPWCGHCKNLTPEWKKAAKALKGVVNMGAVDADKHGALGSEFGVQGFPTIKVFGADKSKPKDYDGGRTAKDLVDAGLKEAEAVAKARA